MINTIKDKQGKPDPRIGLEAMLQTIDVHRRRVAGVPIKDTSRPSPRWADRKQLTALSEALLSVTQTPS